MINFEMPKFKTASEAMTIARTMFGKDLNGPKNSMCKWNSFGAGKGINPNDAKKFVEKAWSVWRSENQWISTGDLVMSASDMEKFMGVSFSVELMRKNFVLEPKKRQQDTNYVYFWRSLSKICDRKIHEMNTNTGRARSRLNFNSSLVSEIKALKERIEVLEEKLKEKDKSPVQKSFNPGQFYGNTP